MEDVRPMALDPGKIRMDALLELQQEQHRQAVQREKARILAGKWWHGLFPWVISIRRR